MAYSVSWVEPPQARDEHLGVWDRNLALPVPARRRFDWLYRDNPAGKGRLALLHAGAGAECPVVGTAGYGLRALQVAGHLVVAAVLADLAVDRAHRTAMPALMLTRDARSQVLARHEVVYAFPNAHAGPLMRKLGYRLLGETRRFVLVIRHGRHVGGRMADMLGATWGARAAPLVSKAFDVARSALTSARAAAATLNYQLAFVAEPDERFDRLWDTARREYPVVGVRNAAFVRWRFVARPEGPLELATLVSRATGELSGYAVIAREGGIAHVRDLFARHESIEPLLRLLCGKLARQGMESVSVRLCGAPWLVAGLTALGFRERDDRRSIIVDAGSSLDAAASDLVRQAAAWHLTDADEDG
jgi:hypothetical protein